ncbi:hypothetical protein EK904_002173 [Melospiza melodia maxima]|nr:hypothetical protein EK904_002173 [Melospiza melodia maxima]
MIWPLPEFDPSQIRLIVYQDCERRGRNVLFDSSAKRKIEDVSVSDTEGSQEFAVAIPLIAQEK